MSKLTYPQTPIPNFPIGRKTKTFKHKSEFMGGYTQQRKKTDKSIKVFSLTYTALTLEEFEELEDFLLSNSTFIFNDPEKDGVSYTCIWPDEELDYSADEPNSYSGSVQIKEV